MAVQHAALEKPARRGEQDVGVAIATRDRADTLAVTLEHLLALPERPRVLVVDNDSTDHTRAMIADRFPDVEILPLSRNRGAVARTAGVRALTTPYVAFSDDGSWWEPGALARAARTLYLARTVPHDRASLRAFRQALAGLPWVVREREVVPAGVENRLRILEVAQRRSTARQYVG